MVIEMNKISSEGLSEATNLNVVKIQELKSEIIYVG